MDYNSFRGSHSSKSATSPVADHQYPPPSYNETAINPSCSGQSNKHPQRTNTAGITISIPSQRHRKRTSAKRPPFERTSSLPDGSVVSARKRYTSSTNYSVATTSTDKDISSGSLDKTASGQTLHNNSSGILDKNTALFTLTHSCVASGSGEEEFARDYQNRVDFVLSEAAAASAAAAAGDTDYRADSRSHEYSDVRVREIANSLLRSTAQRQHDMLVDENNVPCIDCEYTPPSTPFINRPNVMVNQPSQQPFSKLRRKFTSLRFRKSTKTPPAFRNRAGSDISTMSRRPTNPTITVTSLRDGFEDCANSSLLPNNSADQNNTLSNAKSESKVQFIGDEASLYGTPKEESSPTKDVESQRAANSATIFLKDQIISFFQPSDNKLAMKLFGNKNALMKEKQRQKAAGNWVVHPCSNFR